MTKEKIKQQLQRTWIPFFSRFGNFTPIQELTIPHVLRGENVVIISPAATGKTEAVIAPLLENLIKRGSFENTEAALKILYISPTRALVNDLYRRLYDPITYCNISLDRKTGDRPKIDNKHLPHVLLTTPESFDSLLTRQTKIFLSCAAVVLDEIHLLDNTPRGDQLRTLLNRLRKINNNLHYYALSATIDDLTIGSRYFQDAKVCFLKTAREIEFLLIPHIHFVTRLFEIAKKKHLEKLLIFFNARSYVEAFSQKLDQPPFQDKVLVHHASLPKERREEVEKIMNSSKQAILCATSTLELGIDIGDVDGVVLYRPPYNVSSLLQRIGRGNRRTDKLFAIGVYMNDWEKIVFETFFDCAQRGQLFEKHYQPSLSVIPQQIYSYLYQRRRIGTTLKSLCSIFSSIYTEEHIKTVFKTTIEHGTIKENRPHIYYDAFPLEKKIEWGKIHSNIAEISFGEYDVYDIAQGNVIGRIFHVRELFILGGRCWQIVQIIEKEKKIYARCVGKAPGIAQVFEGKGAGNYNFLLAPVLKQRVFPELTLHEFPIAYDKNKMYIMHLFGQLYGFITADSLWEENIEAIDVEGKLLILNNATLPDNHFPLPKPESIKTVIAKNLARLEDALGSGAYFYDLPVEYQVEDHYLNLDIDRFLEFLTSVSLVTIEIKKFQEVLKIVK
jgi:ATP-dependent Lhr-like helicase